MSAEATFAEFIRAYNDHDAAKIEELLAPDVTEDQLGLIRSAGSEQVVGIMKALWNAYSGLTVEAVEILASGDASVTYKGTISGTHTGTLFAPDGVKYPPSGNRVKADVLGFVQLREGKISRLLLGYNAGLVFAQIRGEVEAPS